MRIEATVPDSRGVALAELAGDLGLTRSQVVDEALGLFLKAVIEVRRGRRVVTVDSTGLSPVCEISTPTLALLEWAAQRETISLTEEGLAKVADLVSSPPPATESLKLARSRRKA